MQRILFLIFFNVPTFSRSPFRLLKRGNVTPNNTFGTKNPLKNDLKVLPHGVLTQVLILIVGTDPPK